jgi:hypothetical protein
MSQNYFGYIEMQQWSQSLISAGRPGSVGNTQGERSLTVNVTYLAQTWDSALVVGRAILPAAAFQAAFGLGDDCSWPGRAG